MVSTKVPVPAAHFSLTANSPGVGGGIGDETVGKADPLAAAAGSHDSPDVFTLQSGLLQGGLERLLRRLGLFDARQLFRLGHYLAVVHNDGVNLLATDVYSCHYHFVLLSDSIQNYLLVIFTKLNYI
jgi:hypothetical protein